MNKLKQSVQSMAPPNISLTMSGLSMPGIGGVKVEGDLSLKVTWNSSMLFAVSLKLFVTVFPSKAHFFFRKPTPIGFSECFRSSIIFNFFFRSAFAKTFDSIPALRAERGPLNVILQRICEFSNLTANSSSVLSERIQHIVAEPWYAFSFFPCSRRALRVSFHSQSFVQNEITEARRKKDAYDKVPLVFIGLLEY
jgi:hypothetical protein